MLGVTVHAADSSGPQEGSPRLVTADPGVVSGGFGATPLAARSAAPAVTGAQAFTGTAIPPGPVHRNVPLDVNVPRAALSETKVPAPLAVPGANQGQAAERDPVEGTVAQALPATQGVLASVQEVRAPLDELAQLAQAVAPLEEGIQPAMAMLSPLPPG
ncbi:MAG: hypothetical protein ACRDSN_00285 [Pseudonocardiaceae bacterium]